jgi:HlyD family secretion protein
LKVLPHDLKAAISTNGIIEPVDGCEIYAPIDAFVAAVRAREGMEIQKGRLLVQLESQPLRTSLAEVKAALLQARRQAQAIVAGPQKEEISSLEASIAECELQLAQQSKELQVEESLLMKQATTQAAVENLRKQQDLLQLKLKSLRLKREAVLQRYSAEEKAWEKDKVSELSKQVDLLEQQLQMESVVSPQSGLVYSIQVKPGSYVTKGQLLAQIYEPGKIRLRAYVDEPDLGRIAPGQAVRIDWDGLPDRHWMGKVERPAEQVVALNNRSIGYVLCSIEGAPRELIPNLNVKVEIATEVKTNVISIPRSAILNIDGKPAVLLLDGNQAVTRDVETGMVTSEEIEVLRGIRSGDSVILNPGEAR